MEGLSIEELWKIDENSAIRTENKKIIHLLQQWIEEPDELGKKWWDSFELELATNRLSLGEKFEDNFA